MSTWDGDEYQRRFDRLAERGADVHGEADLVMAYSPRRVLDAGCGTGRVAIELARRGVDVIGVDADASMIATARRRAPELSWIEASLEGLELGASVELVVMAGNVVLFTPKGTEAALVAGCAHHLAPGGRLIAGFSLDRGYGVDDYDRHAADAGLVLEDRWSTWDRAPFADGADYAVSVHRYLAASDAAATTDEAATTDGAATDRPAR
ncbi:MAG: class I SAM-dependent methyltransferase [Microthrixaceae bacterium]